MIRRTTIACVGIMLLATAAWGQDAKTILDKFPAKNSADDVQLTTELLKLGPAGLKATCAAIIPLGSGDDTKARFAVAALTRNAGAQRAVVSQALAEALLAAGDDEVRAFFIQHLQLVGGDEAVPALAKMLAEPRVCDPAAVALTAIATPAAEKALLDATPSADSVRLVPLMKALGTLRSKAATPLLLKLATGDNAALREVALSALADSGAPEATEVLRKQADGKSPQAISRLLRYARRTEREAGTRLARGVLTGADMPAHLRSDALSTLVTLQGEAALKDLLAAAGDPNIEFRIAALKLAAQIPGAAATEQWVARLGQIEAPAIRGEILAMLGARGDKAAIPGVRQALADKDESVQLAAIAALVRIAGDDAVDDLLAAAQSESPTLRSGAAAALVSLPGDKALTAVAGALAKADVKLRPALIDILATRVARPHADAVLVQASSDNAEVRSAALKALGKLAGEEQIPALVKLAVNATATVDEEAALAAVTTAAQRLNPPEVRAESILAALPRTSGAKRGVFLRAIGRLGGAQSLATVIGELDAEAAPVRDAALRALADWPDASALPALLKAAENEKEIPRHVTAVRGTIRLIGASVPAAEKVKAYQSVLALARRPDEKRAVLSALANERGQQALNAATALLDGDLKAEAALAVIRIALPVKGKDQGLSGKAAADALEKAIPWCPDAALKQQAEAHVKKIKPKG